MSYIIITVSQTCPRQDFNVLDRYRSHHDVAHLRPLTNVLTNDQLPTPYSFHNITQKNVKGAGHYSKVRNQIKATL